MKPKKTWPWAMATASAMLAATCVAWAEPPEEDRPSPPDPTDRPRAATPVTVVVPTLERIYAGWAAHPIGASPTSAAIAENTIQLFKDTEFRDDLDPINNVMSMTPGGVHDLPDDMEDSVSSLRWNLAPGIVAVLYEDDGAKGEQLALWGKGEMDRLSQWNFNDKPSSWAWYYAGGAPNVTTVLERAAVVCPTGTVVIAREVPVMTPGTLNLYRNDDFDGQHEVIADVMAQPHGQLHRLPSGLNDDVSSMRWNLPPGVVVTFYQDAQGEKQQAAIWGNGQVSDVNEWDFNDKISRWAWHYIGTRDVNVLGYVEPVVPVPAPARVTVVTPPAPVVVTPAPAGAFIDPLDMVGAVLTPNPLGLTVKDLVARKNPNGEGTFVYAPRVMGAPAERRVVWMVLDGRVYAINHAATVLTPSFATPATVDDVLWARTGLNRLNAEQEAVRIVFIE
jgi:hypothetical protein